MNERRLIYFLAGALSVMSLAAFSNQLLPNGLAVTETGIVFPDGTVQTTAAQARRSYYVTAETTYTGLTAPNACSSGYHMASMWEILDPSNLVYDTARGATTGDSGEGPPIDLDGWVRTGRNPIMGRTDPGGANCLGYTSQDSAENGTAAELPQGTWSTRTALPVSPWVVLTRSCNSTTRVWCVEDLS